VAVNTFHFVVDDGETDAENQASIVEQIERLYNDVMPGGSVALGFYISNLVTRTPGACVVRSYSLADSKPRSPRAESGWTLQDAATGVGSGALPREVAICLSYRGEYDSGVRQSSRRGRIFIGPLIIGSSSTSTGEIEATLPVRMSQNIARFFEESYATGTGPGGGQTARAVQWSRKRQEYSDVIECFVDNEFDTQRRRQLDATFRSTTGVTP
jgi:hypothetical protein